MIDNDVSLLLCQKSIKPTFLASCLALQKATRLKETSKLSTEHKN